MIEKGVSHIAYFRTDGGSSKLYTQEYVDEKDKEIENLNNIIVEAIEYLKSKECYKKWEIDGDEVQNIIINILQGADK